ncbi:hypothetical protein [Inquilinus sp. Marseille-Q2685]|uniref:hypothetical protein n=1 Tax=Inquilinus sp. Marseille-Q2685 TaxID=2866581 RepID=UPI001CE3F5ED|nr:hypothetical protein [Inquilinus sp. Marseille-Q2685]
MQKLDVGLDHWEVHFLRRGYDFLRRGTPEGAISALNYLELPPERRAAVFSGPMPVTPLTGREAEEIRRGLGHVIAMEEKRVVVSAPPAAAHANVAMVRFG